MNQETKEKLVAVFNALNSTTVKGFTNICNMAGSMQMLNDLLQQEERSGTAETPE